MGLDAVAVADRVAGVLPALVQQAPLRSALVLDEAVAVAIAPLVDPAERGHRVRPQPVDEVAVAGPVERLAEQDQPERRRVDAAVVGRVRQLAGSGRLAHAQLVEDLAGLRVAPLVELRRLERGEHLERLDRDLRPERERLDRGDDRVAPEQRREPRHAGRDVALALAGPVVHEQAQVGDAPPDGEVEQLVVGRDGGRAPRPGVVRGRSLVARRSAARRGRAGPSRPGRRPATARRSTRRPSVSSCAAPAASGHSQR